tara:strand:+ start:1650 stop:1856 length:207 start_codon:yes stop_codon:yes gene_type:complete
MEKKKEIIQLLKETHEQMFMMITWCERLQIIKENSNKYELKNTMVDEDETGRSILKDLRKLIKYFEEK